MSTLNASIKTTRPRESYLVLFGNPQDPELTNSKKRIEITGRDVVVKHRPDFDTNIGSCGKYLCHCKSHCAMSYDPEHKVQPAFKAITQ